MAKESVKIMNLKSGHGSPEDAIESKGKGSDQLVTVKSFQKIFL
ncbi:hypothetical protein [Wukongibacter sp. M2B1]